MNSLMTMAVKHFANSGNVNQIQQQAAQQKPEDASLFSNALSMLSSGNNNHGQGQFEGLQDLNGDGVVDERDLQIANERAHASSGQVDSSTLGKAGLFSALAGMAGGSSGGHGQQQQQQYGGQQQQHFNQGGQQQYNQGGQQQYNQGGQQQFNQGGQQQYNQGGQQGGYGGQSQGQPNLVASAMSQAAHLFDQKQQNGQVPQGSTKQSAVNQAAGLAIKYLMKNGQASAVTGSSGGASSLLNMAGKFMK
ncbi:hypothetical protein BCR37DRAFT_413265 [Protomyces lactucae-debilis]|uniref:EF-hand domain-containing protein n=1 Tax=Protomyces lactucae-debilis TaxID=2754530 RepID=A0A1Y2FGU7_PROLT|nr:uncharacterized protein BCR37DRAFT_413265 [Protomyces lactucae-debilis]ORY83160.1 hypothetical protein BCR37DRAFT_413265 [Protomyces lactucae-debilis]